MIKISRNSIVEETVESFLIEGVGWVEKKNVQVETDIDNVTSLLGELGIVFEKYEWEGVERIKLEQGTEKVDGYAGFCTDFCFDKSGKFIKVDIYE